MNVRRTSSSSSDSSLPHSSKSSRISFSARMIRCAVLQETGILGKQVLFDNQMKKRSPTNFSSSSLPSSNPALQNPKVRTTRSEKKIVSMTKEEEGSGSSARPLQHDQQVLEMIFGTVPVSGSSITTKIHHLTERHQIMLTLLFTYFPKVEENNESAIPTLSKQKRSSRSTSVKGGGSLERKVQVQEEQECIASASPRKRSISFTSGAKPTTDGKKGLSSPDKGGIIPPRRPQKTTIAIAVFIRVLPKVQAVQDMVHSHYPILLYRLRLLAQILYDTIIKASKQGSGSPLRDRSRTPHSHVGDVLPSYFLQGEFVLQSAFGDLQRSICSFMTYPRLQPPAWYHVVASSDKRSSILKDFILSTSYLVRHFETPEMGFLLSSTITTLLAYHNSWVFTLSPEEDKEKQMDYHGPIQRQISEIYGCVSADSPRTCRVVVLGDSALVTKWLFVLSFFIRSCACKLFTLQQNEFILACPPEPRARTIVSSVAPAPALQSFPKEKNIWSQDEDVEEEEKKVSLKWITYPPVHWKVPSLLSFNPYKKIGVSLFGSYCNAYTSDFVTLGLASHTQELTSQIAIDLWSQCKFWPFGEREYSSPPNTSSRSFRLDAASCIVVDMNKKTSFVHHFSPELGEDPLFADQVPSQFPHIYNRKMKPSRMVQQSLHTIAFMNKNDFPPESCIMCIEDLLAQVYQNSKLLARFTDEHRDQPLTLSTIPDHLSFDPKDVELFAVLQSNLHPRSMSNIHRK